MYPARYGVAGSNHNYHLPVYLTRRGDDQRPTSIPHNAEPRMENFPRVIQAALERQFYEEYDTDDYPRSLYHARLRLSRRVDGLEKVKLGIAFDTAETSARAKRLADLCIKLRTHSAIETVVAYLNLEMPAGNKDSTPQSIANRCYDPRVWRRIIDKVQTRKAENYLRELSFVQRRG